MKLQEAHDMILAEAYQRQLPKHYERDVLAHDLYQLSEDYGEGECGRFLWMLRTNGSHMWTEQNHKSKFLKQTSSVMESWKKSSDDEAYWYHFDGTELKEVTPEQGRKIPWEVWDKVGTVDTPGLFQEIRWQQSQ
jgi:hypothetical protein